MKRSLIAAAVTAAVMAGGWAGFETARFVITSPPASIAADTKPLQPVSVDPSWIRSGNPSFAQVEIFRSPDGRTTNGLWSCTGPTIFEWQFAVDETVYVLEGEVAVDYQGSHFVLLPGQTASFHGGTSATWTVPKYLKKAYTLHNPGPLGRLWRQSGPAR